MADVSVEAKKEVIRNSIRGVPDFPKAGILFWDVTTIMLNHTAFQYTIDLFVEEYKDKKIDVVAGKGCLVLGMLWHVLGMLSHVQCMHTQQMGLCMGGRRAAMQECARLRGHHWRTAGRRSITMAVARNLGVDVRQHGARSPCRCNRKPPAWRMHAHA